METPTNLKLLGFKTSPFVRRVQLALKLKSIPYEYIEQDLKVKSQLLLQSNPLFKKVPVLLVNGKPICESVHIIQYINEVWLNNGPSFLPSDPHDRAVIRFWVSYFDDKWIPISGELRKAQGATLEDAVARAVDGLMLMDEAFVKISKGKPYFGGDNIGLLDIVVGSAYDQIKAREIITNISLLDKTKTPNLIKWGDHFTSNHIVKDVLQSSEEIVEILRASIARRARALN